MGKTELDYATNKGKEIIAVDTGTTINIASFGGDNDIEVGSCRKDSIENAIG